MKRYNALDLELYESASKRFEQAIEAQGDGFAIEVAALERANERAASATEDAPLDPLPSTIGGPNGAPTDDLDLRELLVEAQAQLLQRDAAVEYLTSVSTPRGAARSASRVGKRTSPATRRKASLDAAAGRARLRLDTIRKEIRALEKEGAPTDAAKIEALRRTEASVQNRLTGFERRSAKLGTQVVKARGRKRVRAVVTARPRDARRRRRDVAATATWVRRER